jgi:hypothetical protein
MKITDLKAQEAIFASAITTSEMNLTIMESYLFNEVEKVQQENNYNS